MPSVAPPRYGSSFDDFLEIIRRTKHASSKSDHHKYKVGSVLLSVLPNGNKQWHESANRIPEPLKISGIDSKDSIANGHPTSHGELYLLKDAPQAAQTYLGCNIYFCPTCIKLSAIFNVNALLYDSEATRQKKIRDRFSEGWKELGIPIATAAGLPIYRVNTSKSKIEKIVEGLPPDQRPRLPEMLVDRLIDPSELGNLSEKYLLTALLKVAPMFRKNGAALALAHDRVTGAPYILGASESAPPGFPEDERDRLTKIFEKHRYKPDVCPIMRLMMEASRRNLSLAGGVVVCNFLPRTPRQIDLIASNVDKLVLPEETVLSAGEKHKESYEGMQTLNGLNALQYMVLKIKPEDFRSAPHFPGLA